MSTDLIVEETAVDGEAVIAVKPKGISEAQLVANRDQWASQIQDLQQAAGKLQEELAQTQQQIAVLTGAVTACNVFLQNLQEFE